MRNMKLLIQASVAGVLFAGVLGSDAGAQAVLRNPSECEVAGALGVAKPGCPSAMAEPGTAAPKRPGTRGLAIGNIDQMPNTPPPAATGTATPARHEYKANFQINFEFGSAQLTEDAKQVLKNIGSVMGGAGSAKFRIVGHTDAVGSSSRNQELSERRAAAVKDYLIATFNLDPSRLSSAGMGQRHLLNPGMPTAGENRRVEITNLGG